MSANPRTIEQAQMYSRLTVDLISVFEGERDLIANMANCAALLYRSLPELNWSGFYRMIGDDLVLGPFQGLPACVRIASGRGVCGSAALTMSTIVVPDVHQFPGHIACDAASQSEIVVPLIVDGRTIGVLDLDSPVRNRFDHEDAKGLQELVAILLQASDL